MGIFVTTGAPSHGAVDLSKCGLNGAYGDTTQTCGNEILAAGGGTVEYVVSDPSQGGGCGITVYINHGEEYDTKYCHLFEARVAAGDTVSAGQVIGIEGATQTSAVHLHLEVFPGPDSGDTQATRGSV